MSAIKEHTYLPEQGGDYDPNQATLVGFGTLSTDQRKLYYGKFGWSQLDFGPFIRNPILWR